MKNCVHVLAWAALTCRAVNAAPIVLFDSFPAIGGPAYSISGPTSDLGSNGAAMPFSTTAQSLTLVSVEAAIGFDSSGTPSGDSLGTGLEVGLYSDAAGLPGLLLATLTLSGRLPSTGIGLSAIFLPQTQISLDPNTTYWVAALSEAQTYAWEWSSEQIDTLALSNDQGATWSSTFDFQGAMTVTVDDGAAPELSSTGARTPLFSFLLGFGMLLNRRPRRNDRKGVATNLARHADLSLLQ